MLRPQRFGLFFCSLLGVSLIAGCSPYREPSAMGVAPGMDSAPVEYNGSGKFTRSENIDTGIFVPDGRGGFIHVPGRDYPNPDPGYAEAQEIRLKAKELAAQLLEVNGSPGIGGLVALPTSFVNLNNFNESNPLGRYMAEAMFYEFNQRGVPVREYRLNGKISMHETEGEFALTRNIPALSVRNGYAAVLVGTYLKDRDGVFINSRLVRPSDGLVLRTAQLVLDNNSVLARMCTRPLTPGTLRIRSGSVPVKGKKVTSKNSRAARSVAQVRNEEALVPTSSDVQPSTAQIQARQALHALETQPGMGADISSSSRTGDNGKTSGNQGTEQPRGIYSGPAEPVPSLPDNPGPIPGPSRNT